MSAENNSDIPQRYVDFCRAVSRLAKEYKLHNLKADFNPDFDDPWHERIEMFWASGRHYADVNKVHITSTRYLNTTVEESQ